MSTSSIPVSGTPLRPVCPQMCLDAPAPSSEPELLLKVRIHSRCWDLHVQDRGPPEKEDRGCGGLLDIVVLKLLRRHLICDVWQTIAFSFYLVTCHYNRVAIDLNDNGPLKRFLVKVCNLETPLRNEDCWIIVIFQLKGFFLLTFI